MTDITFDQGDERALAFIDTEDIIKHLEEQGYQVIDKSEHGDVLEQIQKIKAEFSGVAIKPVKTAQVDKCLNFKCCANSHGECVSVVGGCAGYIEPKG